MAKINGKKKVQPNQQLDDKLTLNVRDKATKENLLTNKYMIKELSNTSPTVALKKEVQVLEEEMTIKTNDLHHRVEEVALYTLKNTLNYQDLLDKFNTLTYRFYTFVGLTVVVSIVINLYNWFS
jgi:hypothetical protein